ncbi:Phosphoglucosamine mutase [compost metagenome]
MAEMIRGGYNLGGEQSGHVIFLEYNTTGDGILTAIQLVDTLIASGQSLSELKKVMKQYPQVLVNVRVQDKSKYVGNVAIEQAIAKVEDKLSDNGRVLVRPSGTESLIRVMAEGPEKQELEELVGQIVAVVEKELV